MAVINCPLSTEQQQQLTSSHGSLAGSIEATHSSGTSCLCFCYCSDVSIVYKQTNSSMTTLSGRLLNETVNMWTFFYCMSQRAIQTNLVGWLVYFRQSECPDLSVCLSGPTTQCNGGHLIGESVDLSNGFITLLCYVLGGLLFFLPLPLLLFLPPLQLAHQHLDQQCSGHKQVSQPQSSVLCLRNHPQPCLPWKLLPSVCLSFGLASLTLCLLEQPVSHA